MSIEKVIVLKFLYLLLFLILFKIYAFLRTRKIIRYFDFIKRRLRRFRSKGRFGPLNDF